jgi:hypothetical protein
MGEPGQLNTFSDLDAPGLEPISLRHLLLRGACVGHRGSVVGLDRRFRDCHCEDGDDTEMQIENPRKPKGDVHCCMKLIGAKWQKWLDNIILYQTKDPASSSPRGCGGTYVVVGPMLWRLERLHFGYKAGVVGPMLRRLERPHSRYKFNDC